MDLIIFWHIHAGDFCQRLELIFTHLVGLNDIDDIVDDFLALADDKRVDEGVHRFGVGRGMSARDDDGIGFAALNGTDGDSGQIQDVECVSVKSFVGQGKADQVESAQSVF